MSAVAWFDEYGFDDAPTSVDTPCLRLASDLEEAAQGVIRVLFDDDDALRLWRRWVGRRTVLQLGWSPLQNDDPRSWMDVELYAGIKLRR